MKRECRNIKWDFNWHPFSKKTTHIQTLKTTTTTKSGFYFIQAGSQKTSDFLIISINGFHIFQVRKLSKQRIKKSFAEQYGWLLTLLLARLFEECRAILLTYCRLTYLSYIWGAVPLWLSLCPNKSCKLL